MNIAKLFISFGHGLVFVAITLLFVVVAKKIADWRTKKFDDDHEITIKGNMAVGFRRFGLYLAIFIAFLGTLSGASQGFWNDVWALLVDGVVIMLCLFTCRAVNDFLMLHNINNDDEALKGNVAVGIVEAGMYIGTALILNGSFSGNGGSMLAGVWSAFVFFVVGQAALLGCGLCYELITTNMKIQVQIEKANPAAGLALAGILIALGVILRAALAGPSLGWTQDFIGFGLYAGYGIIMLLLCRAAIDKFLLPTAELATLVKEKQNVAALAITEAGIIGSAIIISGVM